MYGAVLHTLGKPPRYQQFADPVAREGGAIVEVHAASLKPVDSNCGRFAFRESAAAAHDIRNRWRWISQ